MCKISAQIQSNTNSDISISQRVMEINPSVRLNKVLTYQAHKVNLIFKIQIFEYIISSYTYL